MGIIVLHRFVARGTPLFEGWTSRSPLSKSLLCIPTGWSSFIVFSWTERERVCPLPHSIGIDLLDTNPIPLALKPSPPFIP